MRSPERGVTRSTTLATGETIRHMEHLPERLAVGQLVLRRERLGDEDIVAEAVAANLEHLRPWMPWATETAATPAAQHERMLLLEQWWQAGTDYSFLLLDHDEENLLGIFGLHRRIGPGAIELGYWLVASATGHGHATQAAGVLTSAALDLSGISRVEIHCDEANARSQMIPARLGYRLDRIEPDEVEAPAEVGRSMIWAFPA